MSCPVRTKDTDGLASRVIDDNVTRERDVPPLSECQIEHQAEKYSASEETVDDCHPSFGNQDWVAQLRGPVF